MTLRSLELRNRIWVAPMCQYAVTAQDGVPTDVHLAHYGARASGGAADVIAISRVALREPSWPLRAARELGADPQRYAPEAYARALR
ncbi:hypothetical protein [Brachybacterium timonense]|uniref:oxidoreductase n=1 Tax=Brachybacterium timonense TaxID=2050896 RepID=UPI000D0B57D7